MWGTIKELEIKRRIDVAAYAYAYEIDNDPIVDDNVFDILAATINTSISTGNRRMDNFFKKEFQPYTSAWIHRHPELDKLERIVKLKRLLKRDPTVQFTGQDLLDIASNLKKEIDDLTAHIYDDGHRNHLGASMIGDDCARKLWYSFRWCHTADFVDRKGVSQKGRMMRLFNRGHNEEFRLLDWLKQVGVIVDEFDPDSKLYYRAEDNNYSLDPDDQYSELYFDVTGDGKHQELAMHQGIKRKQLRMSACDGHFGGSLDGIVVKWPEHLNHLPRMIAEFKTSSSKYFDKLVEEGIKAEKPIHYTQMSVYGLKYDLNYGLYIVVNKDNDDMYIEIVELNHAMGAAFIKRGGGIINSRTPPPKINENSAFWKCRFCDFQGICHNNEPYEKNCRSCKFSAAGPNKTWTCAYYGTIPEDFIKQGCDYWQENR